MERSVFRQNEYYYHLSDEVDQRFNAKWPLYSVPSANRTTYQ